MRFLITPRMLVWMLALLVLVAVIDQLLQGSGGLEQVAQDSGYSFGYAVGQTIRSLASP